MLKQIRPGITLGDNVYIERVKKAALAGLQIHKRPLEAGRVLMFEEKNKHTEWFKPNKKVTVSRQEQPKVCPVVARSKYLGKAQ